CTGYWDRAVFAAAVTAVAPGGLLAWEAFTAEARRARPGLCQQWCLADGEPASLLGAGFEVLDIRDLPAGRPGPPPAPPAPRSAPACRGGAGLLRCDRVAVPGQPGPGVPPAGHYRPGRGHVPQAGRG